MMRRNCKTSLLLMFVIYITRVTSRPRSADQMAMPPPLRHPAPAPFGLRGQEPYTNMTIDQLILKSMGGINVAQGLMVQDGKILAELDMMLSNEQFYSLYEFPSSELMAGQRRKKRKAARDVTLRWPHGVVPYTIVGSQYSEQERYWIKRAMTEWERYTCVKFRQSTAADRNLVRFQNGFGCNSELGMVGGVQALNLESPACRWKGLYLHEIGHAMGLVHEHQLPTRDNFIEVLYQNVDPSMRIWFNKYSDKQVNQYNVPYEYSSAMHYGITAFARDGRSQTIRSKQPEKEKEIGQVWRKELSFSDVKVVNLMYKCAANCPTNIWCTNGGYVDQNCRCICPDGSNDCQVKTTAEDVITREEDKLCMNQFDGWRCAVWANQGECEKNPEWMEQNCAKACGKCGAEQRVENKDICEDEFPIDKCAVWRKRGDCESNPGWMTKNCKKTCNFCEHTEKPETNCRNTHTDSAKCDQWAVEGECQVNRVWMSLNCQKACRVCSATDEPDVGDGDGDGTDEDKEPCVNRWDEKECTKWALRGECIANPTWMANNCRKACGKCDDGECKNLERDKSCESWKKDGECKIRPAFMKKGCALTCGFCQPEDGNSNGDKEPEVDNGDKEPEVDLGNDGKDKDNSGGNCKDDHNTADCKVWADAGHCSINPSYMLNNCKKSCAVCTGSGGSEDGGGGGNEVDNKDVDDDTCVDNDSKCSIWEESDYCDSNAGYMLKFCRKSCQNCEAKCQDLHMLCPIWGKGGHCSSNASYMLRSCQKTCKVCTR